MTLHFDIITDDFDEYMLQARKTAIYPTEAAITYPLLGLVGEVGEFANKYKKVIRDNKPFERNDMRSELGDILWYLANICSDAGIPFGEVAEYNLAKLMDRKDRGVLGGSGDTR